MANFKGLCRSVLIWVLPTQSTRIHFACLNTHVLAESLNYVLASCLACLSSFAFLLAYLLAHACISMFVHYGPLEWALKPQTTQTSLAVWSLQSYAK